MAVVDPYAACPCGSGEKFKWCCHKVEAYADKSRRLLEAGQTDASIAALDEGLAKSPGNPWLSTRKAATLVNSGHSADVIPLLEPLTLTHPEHPGVRTFLIRASLEVQGPEKAVEALQKALLDLPPTKSPTLATITQLIGMVLYQIGEFQAARKHLELAAGLYLQMNREPSQDLISTMRHLAEDTSISPVLRNPYQLSPAPESLEGEMRDRFESMVTDSRQGRWSAAAAGFELLAADGVVEAERNLGLCRLWMMDQTGARAAFERYVKAKGESTEAVDVEMLRQAVMTPEQEDLVELVHLIWTLRDRAQLLAALRASDRVFEAGEFPLDPEDEHSVTVLRFDLLDRPRPAGEPPKQLGDYPLVLGRALVGQEIAILEALDDGRLDDLTTWFTDLAGMSLPPAQPKTKEIGKLVRDLTVLQEPYWLPGDLPEDLMEDLSRQQQERLFLDRWPTTSNWQLGRKTPEEISKSGDAVDRVRLRAALFTMEINAHDVLDEASAQLKTVRERLGVDPEPEIDLDGASVEDVSLARLHLVKLDALDDDTLLQVYLRCRTTVLPLATSRAARVIVERPELLNRLGAGRVVVHADLANSLLAEDNVEGARETIRRGREGDPDAGANALRWDFADLRIRARVEPPENWVPTLAVIMDRTSKDTSNASVVLSNLVEMGLVQPVPNPNDPEDILLDSRPLQALLEEYGPRITTASGELGVSVGSGSIWTPGSDKPPGGATTSGGLWTPGSARSDPAPGSSEKPKLFFPGR